jgi:hypothetical protein
MVDQILGKARRVNSFISRMTMANLRARLMGPSAFDFSSYSQSGEDRIIEFFLNTTGLENATYLDIGASHPMAFNNTYLLYRRGLRGVCVDPEPGLDRLRERLDPAAFHRAFQTGRSLTLEASVAMALAPVTTMAAAG